MAEVSISRKARLLFQLPPKCRVFRKINPTLAWGWKEVLLNKANYYLELLVWSKTEDATKGRNKPEPYYPPFMKKPKKNPDEIAMDIDDIQKLLTSPRI